MDKRPIRRKFKDNPYKLNSIESEGIYLIDFNDVVGNHHSIQVSNEIFRIFDESEKKENALFFEYSKHIVHTEININNFSDKTSIEDTIINKDTILELKKYINELSDIHRRRLKKYYFEDKTFEQIAQEEGCTKRAIKFSIDIALEKISQNFKN